MVLRRSRVVSKCSDCVTWGDVRGILEFLASGQALRPTHPHSVDTVGGFPRVKAAGA